MAVAVDALAPWSVGAPDVPQWAVVPPGWDIAKAVAVADIRALPPDAQVEIEVSPDFYSVSLFRTIDVISNVPSVAQQLDAAAQAYGSRVYAVILLHTVELDFLGVQIDRYRWIIVHTQFPALIALLAIPVVIAIVAVWLECQGKTPAECGQLFTGTAHDTAQALCNVFGAGCALQALGGLLIAFSVASIGLAGALFFLESGIAERMGVRKPQLPRIPAPTGIQPPRISATVGAPEFGPQVRVATGGRAGGRRGMSGLRG